MTLSTKRAIEFIEKEIGMKITLPTLLTWTRDNDLGAKVGGRWRIDKEKLVKYIYPKSKEVV